MVLLQTSLFTLLGAVAFIVPLSAPDDARSIHQGGDALVFIVGACSGLVHRSHHRCGHTSADRLVPTWRPAFRDHQSVG